MEMYFVFGKNGKYLQIFVRVYENNEVSMGEGRRLILVKHDI